MAIKVLDGAEVAGFVKERQVHSVKSLRSRKIHPKMMIFRSQQDPVIDMYLRIKQRYAQDIGVECLDVIGTEDELLAAIRAANDDPLVHGIIIQLPLQNGDRTRELLDAVSPSKDIDGIATKSQYDPATPTAILWLLSAYAVDLRGKNIVIVGQGTLVGAPLATMLQKSDITPEIIDEHTKNAHDIILNADVIITGVGKPGVVRSEDIKPGAIVVDAGVASEQGVLKGDVDDSARNREDIKITPLKGGVGPLTVCALFENLLRAAGRA